MRLQHNHYGFHSLGIIAFVLALSIGEAHATPNPPAISREILSLYFDSQEDDPRLTLAHQYGEVILNHLGFTVRNHNVRNGLPSLDAMENVKGILAWFNTEAMPDPAGFIHWTTQHIERGKHFVWLGSLAFAKDLEGKKLPRRLVNKLLKHLGLEYDGSWVQFTYGLKIIEQSELFAAFEGPVPNPMPPFFSMHAVSPQTNVLLSVTSPQGTAPHVLAALTPTGGYAASGYILHHDESQPGSNLLYWIINPWEFFRSAFDTDNIPKPDTSTLTGQRIYYAHVDGDGWNNLSEIKDTHNKRFIAAQIILDQVISAFSFLPVTVAPIAADLHPDWRGTEQARKVARKLFRYPHVEAGTHTFTHPYIWQFFEDYTVAKESRYRSRYLRVSSLLKRIYQDLISQGEFAWDAGVNGHKAEHETYRTYLDEPFFLAKEIAGSVEYIESLTPPGKTVKILQWTGDTKPFEQAIAEVEALGIPNINGGVSRLDASLSSLARLAPVGVRLGDQLQIYASNSSESTYLSQWTHPYFGFRSLLNTLRKTETPFRIKPFHLYYHISAGEQQASLNAVLDSLNLAKVTPLTPITTSHYAMIGKGFFSTRFIPVGQRQWKILNRGALQTIRFDKSALETVDFERSRGILGHQHYQGSLYVALDEAVQEPVLALQPLDRTDISPLASRPYLVSSRWRIWDFQYDKQGRFSFVATGFGDGDMEWRTPRSGAYEIVAYGDGGTVLTTTHGKADAGGRLQLKLQTTAIDPIRITVQTTGP